MSERQLDRDDVHNFLLPYRSRVYDPFKLLAEVQQEFESWEEDGSYKQKMTFKLKNVVENEHKVYGISEEMMNYMGAWRSPMSGKNWWVNPLNPNAGRYSDIRVKCDGCGAEFGGTSAKNSHETNCPNWGESTVRDDLHEARIEWLSDASMYGLDIGVACRRLGLKFQTVRDMVWQEEGFSYQKRKKEGKRRLATTWEIALNWGTDCETLAQASGFTTSTVYSYITLYSQIEGEVPPDPTSDRS